MTVVPFNELKNADLVVDRIYEGGVHKDVRDDPITKLLPGIGNQGGFRVAGNPKPKYVVLYTSGEEKDWPDELDQSTGRFTFYGDNRTPGKELHDTIKGGNELLRKSFEFLHDGSINNKEIPPFLVFKKNPTPQSSRAVQFLGLAVPGYPGLSSTEDLVAIWKHSAGKRFQNYRAIFTVLDVHKIPRAWLNNLNDCFLTIMDAPEPWRVWVEDSRYTPLISSPKLEYRTPEQQLPRGPRQQQMLQTIYSYFEVQDKGSRLFEFFAADLFKMFDGRVVDASITPASSDGGRDVLGYFEIGVKEDPVRVEFALEAKLYRPGLDGERQNSVGVREVARLISRIRNRQFGVMLTTSVVSRQTYEEVRRDGHPIIFISGKDIVETLVCNGINTSREVEKYLSRRY